ncbi:MAG: hypothetical protein ACRDXX_18115, partial [Stackebrandtia sp.]
YHDGCRCTAEPVYSRAAPWPDDARELDRLWRDSTRGLSGAAARRAFRRAVDARNRQPEPADEMREQPAEPDRKAGDEVPERASSGSGTPPEAEPESSPDEPEPDVAALNGTDLAALSDDELFALFGEYGDDPAALEAITAELDRRDGATPDPLDGVELSGLGEAWLDRLAADHADNDNVVSRIDAERARRAKARAAQRRSEPEPAPTEPEPRDDLTPDQQRVDELVRQGWDWQEAYAEAYSLDADELERQARAAEVDAHRAAGETREDTVRRLYREHVDLQYVAAETATRGHMLSKEGVAAGIDPRSLFSGATSRARRYASEDLQRWWAEHGRTTFTEFRAQLLGREADKRAAAVTALQGNGRDFI